MSYTDQAIFASAGEIQQLSFDEIGEIGGGPLPIVAAYYLIAIVGTIYVAAQAGLALMRLGYATNKQ